MRRFHPAGCGFNLFVIQAMTGSRRALTRAAFRFILIMLGFAILCALPTSSLPPFRRIDLRGEPPMRFLSRRLGGTFTDVVLEHGAARHSLTLTTRRRAEAS